MSKQYSINLKRFNYLILFFLALPVLDYFIVGHIGVSVIFLTIMSTYVIFMAVSSKGRIFLVNESGVFIIKELNNKKIKVYREINWKNMKKIITVKKGKKCDTFLLSNEKKDYIVISGLLPDYREIVNSVVRYAKNVEIDQNTKDLLNPSTP